MGGLALAFDIALAHLLRRKRQTVVSVLGVALGVGFFIGMASMMQGFQRYFVAKIIDIAPHVTIKDEFREPHRQPTELAFASGAVEVRGVKPREEIRGIRGSGQVLGTLNALDGTVAAPTLRGQIILRYGNKDVAASAVGIEPQRERRVTNMEADMTVGRLDDLTSAAAGIILGGGVARKLGARQGDTLVALSPSGGTLRVKVVGILKSGIVSIDNSECYLLLRKAQALLGRPNVVNQVRIKLDDPEGAGRFAQMIEGRFGYRTESWEEQNRNVLGVFVIQNGIMYSTIGAILVVAAFGIFNIISTVVHEKTRDIAILRSIGLDEGDIRLVFVIEGATVGIIGSLMGWLLGYGLVQALGAVRFDIEGFVKTQGFVLYETPNHYLIAGALALVAATFAAWLPARKAAALRPVDIVRGAA